ncbi:MAG: phosphoribosylformylglycinamidine cyclo-ligase [Bacillota bacterium]|nr:phosphoribosylformylglycinamidine cyclo-ligase [Bacillota bacterium]
MQPRGESYRRAGVDLEAGYEVVRRVRRLAASTFRPGVLGEIGGFGGLFALDTGRWRKPVLVAGADGVGTKLKLASCLGRHNTVGIDLVAMCVNDVAVLGAEPLFFLDYFATGRLDPEVAEEVLSGIAEGCRQAGCALLGGETAEMPGFYGEGEYDLAGFAVGVVEEDQLWHPAAVRPGDQLLGVASSGLHSNGFSLVRRILAERNLPLDGTPPGLERPLGEELLTPTRIYVRALLSLRGRVRVKAAAHITGGGFYENIPRALGPGCRAFIRKGSWPVPPIFPFLAEQGGLSEEDLFGTFNLGLGLVLVLPPEEVEKALALLAEAGERAYLVGQVAEGEPGVELL